MTIKFYPSTMPGEPLEVHEWVGTFGAWLDAEEVEWRDKEHQRIFVKVNGQDLLPDTWDVVQLVATDEVSVYPIANGDIFKGLGNILGAIFGAVFGWLLPSQGGGNDYRSPARVVSWRRRKAKPIRPSWARWYPSWRAAFVASRTT